MWLDVMMAARLRLSESRRARRTIKALLSVEKLDHRWVPAVVNPAAVNLPINGLTIHTWTPDANGLYHTGNLAAEWQANYQTMLAGKVDSLTPIQRWEGNAEAVFENTALKNLSAAQQQVDREDTQREIDAAAAAMAINKTSYNIDPTKPLTDATYLKLEYTLQNNPILLELAVQGHGLNNPPSPRYNGYTNDFQNNVDTTTLFVGGGLNQNQNALTDFFDDSILTHVPYAVIWQNGHAEQLNQNGAAEDRLEASVIAMDETLYGRVYKSTDFAQAASTTNNNYKPLFQNYVNATKIKVNVAPSGGAITTLWGAAATTVTINNHTWTADAYTGLYHTNTDLAAEWKGFYQKMQDGNAGGLTPVQRQEGNAEAVFEKTAIAQATPETQRVYREDAQREFDAIAAAMAKANLTKPLTTTTYVTMEQTLQNDNTLHELAIQGHGLNNPPSVRYQGYTNDFQNNVDGTTKYVGGGLNNHKNALTDFFDDNILTHAPFVVVWQNGKLVQLNQNGNAETGLQDAVYAFNQTLFFRTYTPDDFRA